MVYREKESLRRKLPRCPGGQDAHPTLEPQKNFAVIEEAHDAEHQRERDNGSDQIGPRTESVRDVATHKSTRQPLKSYHGGNQVYRNWIHSNPDKRGRPLLIFPDVD